MSGEGRMCGICGDVLRPYGQPDRIYCTPCVLREQIKEKDEEIRELKDDVMRLENEVAELGYHISDMQEYE